MIHASVQLLIKFLITPDCPSKITKTAEKRIYFLHQPLKLHEPQTAGTPGCELNMWVVFVQFLPDNHNMMSGEHEFFNFLFFFLHRPPKKIFVQLVLCLCLFLFILNCNSVILWRVFHHFVQIVIQQAEAQRERADRPRIERKQSFYRRTSSTKVFQAFSTSSNSSMRLKTGNSESASPMMHLNHRGLNSSCAEIQISYYYSCDCIPACMVNAECDI